MSEAAAREQLLARFVSVRRATERLGEPLEPEDYNLQPMTEASPVKWHLAHTTWFFETFVLARRPGHRPFDPRYGYLFNSYYDSLGPRHPRTNRGLLSRPTIETVFAYRKATDDAVRARIETADDDTFAREARLIEIGLQHEQQHQELILTDVKIAFYQNPLRPVYSPDAPELTEPGPSEWRSLPAGLVEIGHAGDGFAFDNEAPRHRVYLHDFAIASRPVTCDEFLEFLNDGGYRRPELWLSDGWAACRANDWTAPLYWERSADGWTVFTLRGPKPLNPDEPACHLSYYEADAFARWSGARLPTEAEWETAATAGAWPAERAGVWEWTASPYGPYPGFRAADGALGEYNGKFMCNQMVLRGGSIATPRGHTRPTYRNFFPPAARWQFSGLRLAR